LQADWNAKARNAGAAKIVFSNSEDMEATPKLPSGFEYLESGYEG
jgi:hypothetical protein